MIDDPATPEEVSEPTERLESDEVGYGRNLEGMMLSEECGEARPNEDTLEPDASWDLT